MGVLIKINWISRILSVSWVFSLRILSVNYLLQLAFRIITILPDVTWILFRIWFAKKLHELFWYSFMSTQLLSRPLSPSSLMQWTDRSANGYFAISYLNEHLFRILSPYFILLKLVWRVLECNPNWPIMWVISLRKALSTYVW